MIIATFLVRHVFTEVIAACTPVIPGADLHVLCLTRYR